MKQKKKNVDTEKKLYVNFDNIMLLQFFFLVFISYRSVCVCVCYYYYSQYSLKIL